MGSTDGPGRHQSALVAATERQTSSDSHQDSHDVSFGVLGIASRREGERSIRWTQKWGIVAILMALGFLSIILGKLLTFVSGIVHCLLHWDGDNGMHRPCLLPVDSAFWDLAVYVVSTDYRWFCRQGDSHALCAAEVIILAQYHFQVPRLCVIKD